MGLIYKITCAASGKAYVGQTTKTLLERWGIHLRHLRLGRRCALQNAMRKYGIACFAIKVLEECPDSALNEREVHWIAVLGTSDPTRGYNRTQGGSAPLTKEVRQRLSTMKLGALNPMFGKHHTPETRARMSRTRKGRPSHGRGKPLLCRDSVMLSAEGQTLSMAEWSRRKGISIRTLHNRRKSGWSDRETVTRPVRASRAP